MTPKRLSTPDIILLMDPTGLIQEVHLSDYYPGEDTSAWIGQPWTNTVRASNAIHLEHMRRDAQTQGVSGFRQVLQHLPGGGEIPIEYTVIRRDQGQGLMAIGKNVQVVTELQNRLVETQQALERDYWKLREVETRYRLLFKLSSEAFVLLDAQNLGIVDLNPVAAQALGLAAHKPRTGANGRFIEALLPDEREALHKTLREVRERGEAPALLLHLGADHQPWLTRAALITTTDNEVFFLQLSAAGQGMTIQEVVKSLPLNELLERGPDAFVAIDTQGAILRANRAFLDMVQMGSETSLLGKPLGRWLGRPGPDLTVLLANVLRLGAVRLFATTLHGELGSEVEVEISASGNTATNPNYIGVFLRDIGRRFSPEGRTSGVGQWLDGFTKQVGKTTLRKLVDDTVEVIERHYILAALELAGGNRTVAAELLGLSRQSLYVKLNRYGMESEGAETRR
jgi:transcriptional regulator PpsR